MTISKLAVSLNAVFEPGMAYASLNPHVLRMHEPPAVSIPRVLKLIL